MKQRHAAATLVFLIGALACSKATPGSATPEPTPTRDYRTQATDWFLRSISPDGRTLSIVYTTSGVASGCERKATTQAVESVDKVTITANKSVLQGDHACTEEVGYIDAGVTLNSRLGSRALVGCRVGKSLPSENSVCRDLERGRRNGVPPPYPSRTR